MKKFIITTLALLPAVSFAAADPTDKIPEATAVTGDPAFGITLLERVGDWIFAFLIVVAVIYFLLAAWNFLMSAGSAEKIDKARTRIIYSAIAVGVALLSRGAIAVIKSVIGT